jgi:hypothetical protein
LSCLSPETGNRLPSISHMKSFFNFTPMTPKLDTIKLSHRYATTPLRHCATVPLRYYPIS